MEAKDERDRLSRFVSKYMEAKCCRPGDILFFRTKDFFYTLFDDALFMALHFGVPWMIRDNIPFATIPKSEVKSYMRKISTIKRAVTIPKTKSNALELIVDNSKGSNPKDNG